MDNAAIKESRRVLRLVQEHLSQAHLNVGATQEHVGLVEVISHPNSELAHLNYVTPRRNTAWIPAPEIERGMERLHDLHRTPRVNYVEGLFPPLFAKSLHKLGLEVEHETAIMTRKLDTLPDKHNLPDGVHVVPVSDQEGIGLWWYVWRNAYYDVLTTGIEPIKIGQDMQQVALGNQVDLLLYRNDFPAGAARVTFHSDTAHLTTLAIMKEARTPALIHALHQAALKTAAQQGCELIFTSGGTEEDRKMCREVGFVDSGSVVCYAEPVTGSDGTNHDVAQYVFALK